MTGNEIRALRERYGWSQQVFAAVLDCGIASVSMWERGQTPPGEVYLDKMRRLEGVIAAFSEVKYAESSKAQGSARVILTSTYQDMVKEIIAAGIKQLEKFKIVNSEYIGAENAEVDAALEGLRALL